MNPLLSHDVVFPPGFVWGTASSSHQSEGNNACNDWWEWEQQQGRIAHGHRSGRANNFYELYDGDFALLAQLGLTQYRLSIEWSRIEPEEGRVNAGEIDHYRRVLDAAHREVSLRGSTFITLPCRAGLLPRGASYLKRTCPTGAGMSNVLPPR